MSYLALQDEEQELLTLKPYQIKTINWLRAQPRAAILGSDPGTGKTACAIAATYPLVENGKFVRRVVICPSSLKLNWEREIRIWGNPSDRIQIIFKLQDAYYIDPLTNWIIVSYKIATSLCHTFPEADFLICDEAHALKGRTTKRTRRILYDYARRCRKVFFVTGTPMPNHIIDAWTLFYFCTQGKVGNLKSFSDNFCFKRQAKWGIHYYGAKNLEKLREMVKPILYRDRIEDVQAELPDFRENKIPLEVTSKADTVLSILEKDRDEIARAIREDRRPRVSTSLSSMRRLLGLEKISETVDFSENLLSQGLPIIIFAYHRDVVNEVAHKLSDEYHVAAITGETPEKDRDAAIKNFQSGELDCIVASIGTLGVGVTLTRAANMVFAEWSWVPAELEQAMARIRRLGQRSFCNYYFLMMGDFDEVILRTVKNKMRTIKKFFEEGVPLLEPEEEQIVWE